MLISHKDDKLVSHRSERSKVKRWGQEITMDERNREIIAGMVACRVDHRPRTSFCMIHETFDPTHAVEVEFGRETQLTSNR